MRFLHRLGQHVAQRKVEIFAVIFATAVLEHRHDGANRVFPDRALGVQGPIKGGKFGGAAALAHAEFDAAVAQQVEGRHPFGDAGWMVGGQLDDAVARADILGPLAGGAKKDFGRRAVRIFFQKKWCSTSQA